MFQRASKPQLQTRLNAPRFAVVIRPDIEFLQGVQSPRRTFVGRGQGIAGPPGIGEHVYATLRRKGWNTPDVGREIARTLGVPSRDVGWAGLKDRNALTTQTFSIRLLQKMSRAEIAKRLRVDTPFDFLAADLVCERPPASGARGTLNVIMIVLAVVMLVGTAAIYQSARAVTELSERRSRFVSAVTHELKTPLSTVPAARISFSLFLRDKISVENFSRLQIEQIFFTGSPSSTRTFACRPPAFCDKSS